MKKPVGATTLKLMIGTETTRPPMRTRGRPALNKPKHVKNMERYMNKEIEKGSQEIEETDVNSTVVAPLQIKRSKTIVKEYNQRT